MPASQIEFRVHRLPQARLGADFANLRGQIITALTATSANHTVEQNTAWTKSLPMRILYEFTGMTLYEEITNSDTYPLYRNELVLLQLRAQEIMHCLIQNTESLSHFENLKNPGFKFTFVDLGSGPIDKAYSIIQAASASTQHSQAHPYMSQVPIRYFAIDLQYDELCTRLSHLRQLLGANNTVDPAGESKTSLSGICGPYFEALEVFLQTRTSPVTISSVEPSCPDRCIEQTHCYLWLGSSMSNMSASECIGFLSRLHDKILKTGDHLLVGVDVCRDTTKVLSTYSDTSPAWQKYILNGVANAGTVLGGDAVRTFGSPPMWEYIARWDSSNHRHLRFAKFKGESQVRVSTHLQDHSDVQIQLDTDELILLGQSYKYSNHEIVDIFHESGFQKMETWTDEMNETMLFLLQKH